jgi:hypothetical protein
MVAKRRGLEAWSPFGPVAETEMEDYPFAYEDDSYPFRSRASANAMLGRFGGGRFRRNSRGVHDECCVKPCSISELLSYCAKPH